MKYFGRQFTEAHEKGQSLVEVALFFPIFLVILAGVVEVSHLVITQNRVTNAARSSTRFAANGGEDAGMVNVTLNTVTQTLEVSDDVWDIWSIRGTLNDGGTGFDDWTFTHIYGITNTSQAPNVNETALQQQVIDELQVDHLGQTSADIAGGLRIVGTYAIHDVESILGLDTIPDLVGFNSIRALSVMRVTGLNLEQTNGCDGFPIAVHEGIRSVTPPGQGSNPFPNAGDFTYPTTNPPPPYPPTYQSFTNHVADIPLSDAREGYVYKVQNGFGAGNFGWLVWNEGINASAQTLNDSLSWPGNATDYNDHNDGGQALPGFNHVVRGYVEPGDPTDTSLHIGDWVSANTGSINANDVQAALNESVDRNQNRALRLMVWDDSQAQGNNGRYRISGFAIFRLLGHSLSQGQGGSWILAEFVRWDNSCGQVSAAP